MKIIDKIPYAPVTGYSVGDVIQDDVSVYMIVKISTDIYGAINLSRGSASYGCDSLEELYDEAHTSGERKVKATVVIEGEES